MGLFQHAHWYFECWIEGDPRVEGVDVQKKGGLFPILLKSTSIRISSAL